jgi:hypothetical protein
MSEDKKTDEEMKAFLSDLTEVSRKHNIGIDSGPMLFIMELEDAGLAYVCDDEGKLARIEE